MFVSVLDPALLHTLNEINDPYHVVVLRHTLYAALIFGDVDKTFLVSKLGPFKENSILLVHLSKDQFYCSRLT